MNIKETTKLIRCIINDIDHSKYKSKKTAYHIEEARNHLISAIFLLEVVNEIH